MYLLPFHFKTFSWEPPVLDFSCIGLSKVQLLTACPFNSNANAPRAIRSCIDIHMFTPRTFTLTHYLLTYVSSLGLQGIPGTGSRQSRSMLVQGKKLDVRWTIKEKWLVTPKNDNVHLLRSKLSNFYGHK